jgi:hypothetical protein
MVRMLMRVKLSLLCQNLVATIVPSKEYIAFLGGSKVTEVKGFP